MKNSKRYHILIATFIVMGMLVSPLVGVTPVQAASDSRAERLNDPDIRLYFWQLERDGINIVQADRLYLVINGDNLPLIAERYGITVERLLNANPQISSATMLLRGELLRIPEGITETAPRFYFTPPTFARVSTDELPTTLHGWITDPTLRLFHWQLERDGLLITQADRLYRVVSGDNWTNIAARYGISALDLQIANPQVTNINIIYRGELLSIPEGITETAPHFYASPKPPSTSQ
jgi:LysM repeat protein